MNTDTNQDQIGTLVAQDNQSNSIVNQVNNSNSKHSFSSLNDTKVDSSPFTASIYYSGDNSINNSIDHSIHNSTNNDNQNDKFNETTNNQLDNFVNQEENEIKDNQLDNEEDNFVNQEENKIKDNQIEEQETINKLDLNLDYHRQTDLNESLTSLSTFNKSETSSIHSRISRENSPSRSSERDSLPPPKRSATVNEISLLFNDIETKNNEEQLRFFKIERNNLNHLASLIINNLINNISPLTKTLDCHDNIVLYDFFSITELICRHGLKSRKLIFGKKELWSLFESIENINPQIVEIIQNIRELPNIKTNNGRVKCFLRLAFVHKVFNEIFNYLIGCKELLRSFYEDGAFILSNEIYEFLNKTDELKEFDFRWCAREEKLDELSTLIDLTSYLVDQDRTAKEIIYKVNVSKNQINELIEEKQFYESKSKEFRKKILFYYNRIKELGIESLFEGELVKSQSKIEFLTKKLNEFFKTPATVIVNKEKDPDILSLQEDIATLKKQLEIELSNRASKEAALEYIESDVLVKQDENIVMRHQIEEVKLVNEELCIKVGELGQMNTDLNSKIVALTNKNHQLIATITELQRNLVATEAKYSQLSTTERLLRKQFEDLKALNESLKEQVLKEKEEKKAVQKKLDDNIERNSTVLTELSIANNRANDYPALKKKHDMLVRKVCEYEQTMEELGLQLQASKLEIENLKEQTVPNDAFWQDDSTVDKCEGCSVLFSVKIRRHHCRACGQIFCSKCSDRKIPLPADSKPCRVCDGCHLKLMQRYNG